jgi:Transposase DDE domain group 1
MAHISEAESPFEIKFTSREVSAWGGMALMKRMLDSMDFQKAASQWDLPEPGSNRGYAPVQLIEQLLVSIWCGACRFTHLDITRLDSTLTRLFGWTRVAGHKAIVRLFERFDMMHHERVQASVYRWFFDTVSTLPSVTVDMDSTVLTRHGEQQGTARGYNPNKRGRLSHHPLLVFVAEARMVANFWLRPGDVYSANNVLQFIESTLHHLGSKTVGLLRADSGFYDQAVFKLLEGKGINYIISARLTGSLQQAIIRDARWFALETGLELAEITYQANNWDTARRIVVVRQSIKRKNAPGKNTVLVCRRPRHSGMALWCDGDQTEFTDSRDMA